MKMESSLWSVLLFVVAISGVVHGTNNVDDESDNSKRSPPTAADPNEQRLRNLEGELQRVKDRLSEVESLLGAWFLSAEQQQAEPVVVSERWSDDENGLEKRAGGGYAFMGSRGKRKQPFILGSRGKRQVDYQLDGGETDNQGDFEKRGAYFYGSRGKKQFVDSTEFRMPPFYNKRYNFMGSRGKK